MTASTSVESWRREIEPRLEALEARLCAACAVARRPRDEVRLIAVSKRKPAAAIRAAHALGLRDFGENYAQELRDKADELADLEGLRWHFIGPLQRNKVRLVAGRAAWLHTVAKASLVDALAQRLAGLCASESDEPRAKARLDNTSEPLSVLLQLSLAGEEQKSGASGEELPALLSRVAQHPQLRCRGLMTMPPASDDPAAAGPVFVQLRQLLVAHREQAPAPGTFDQLSMGMSADLEVAVAAGATMIRVGTAIFGPRLT